MTEESNVSLMDTLVGIMKVVGAILFSFVYIIESIVMSCLPRSFKRHSVEKQVVLITGGGMGLGRRVAQRLAKKGARIVSWDVNAAGNDETVKLIQDEGGECHAYTVDLCDRKAIYRTAEQVKKDVGKVDILVNNAGIVTGKYFMESPDELIQKTFDVNIMCHFWMVKAFLPDMITDQRGHIVTVASLAGMVGSNKLVDYCSSKFAAVGFDESLRVEMMVEGHKDVNTTVICPYYINTGMFTGTKSRVIPILDQDFVADEITDGILMKKVKVIIPWYANFLVTLKTILPHKAMFVIGRAFGFTECMQQFEGRKKTN